MNFGKFQVKTAIKAGIYLLVFLFTSSTYAQQEIRICALRVDFQPDQNPLTTGDGQFIFDSSKVTPFTIDPPPHDRSYFQDQILAVHNYYQAASRSQVNISGTVFPRSQNGAYRLPQEMGFYNPNTTEEENNQQLARLFMDAITIADQDPHIVFADYDLVTIFHAGVGKDIDLGFDSTPQDLPSLYLGPDFFKAALGPDFTGITVDGGTVTINNGIILPETETQDEVEVAITGIFAANIGSYLDLYDLFSPSTKKTGIGRFGLMDIGLFNLFGLVPAIPCAYSRALLGWDIPVVLDQPGSGVLLNRFEGTGSTGTTIFRIPINSDEYYLLEYRGDNAVKMDSLYAVLAEKRSTAPTYLEVLKTYLPDEIEVSDSTGVLLKVSDYDWGLPGAGMLVWHVDESVIAEQGPLNEINDDRENRGVDLEEADGSQDIGFDYTLIEPGYRSEQGTWLDFWFSGNPAPLYKNEFSPTSSPNTRTNRVLANSQITLDNFSSNSGSQMSYSYRREYFEPGFPLRFYFKDSNSIYTDPISVKINGVAQPVIFTADDSGRVMAFTSGGEGLLVTDQYEVARLNRAERPFLSFGDQNSDSQPDILFACLKSGLIQGFLLEDRNGDLRLDTLFSKQISQNFNTPAVVHDQRFYIGTGNNQVDRFTFTGTIDSVYYFQNQVDGLTVISADELVAQTAVEGPVNFSPTVIDLNSDGLWDQVILKNRTKMTITLAGGTLYEVELPAGIVSTPAFGDADEDGFYEIFLNLSDRIYGLYYNGALVNNFPIHPYLQNDEQLIGTPLLFDLDGDQHTDILTCSSKGQIFAFNLKGRLLPGFPLSAGGKVLASPLSTDYDSDDRPELFVITTAGIVFAWQLETSASENKIWWNQSLFNYTANNFIPDFLVPETPGGTELMPAGQAYNYPNPNTGNFTILRYYLREDAQVAIKIFDLAGDLVDHFTGPGQGQIHNEVRWELKDISSGVYLCRIEAVSVREKQIRLVKILVIK